MKILILVNWKVNFLQEKPDDLQPPDFFISEKPYWFFRYFKYQPEVDLIDISSFRWLEKLEKNKIRFYLWQSLKAIPELKKYDLIVSHGMQSAIVLCLWRRFFKTKAKHIVFDIGSFNSAAEKGLKLKLMQFASKSLDRVIYHTSSQINYYNKFFPWIVEKSKFIRFGTDIEYFNPDNLPETDENDKYIICVGYSKRDWPTVVDAYKQLHTTVKLRLIGHVDKEYSGIHGVEQIPFVPINELIKQINHALYSVLPLKSFNYSYGQMTLMQQMALGKCVIAAKVPSLVDYVQDGKTGIFYEPGNSHDLYEKMLFLLENEAIMNKIGCNGRNYLQQYCNEKIMALEIEKELRVLL